MPAPIRDGFLVSLALCFLYCLFTQQSLYKIDGHLLLRSSYFGQQGLDYLTFYGPGLECLKTLCYAVGMNLFETAGLYSAMGAALGVLFLHLACRRLGMSRANCIWATLLAGLCPSLFFFATVVESHGPFFVFAGLVSLAMAHLVRTPTWPIAILTGLSLGIAYLAHPTGMLMLGLIPTLLFITRKENQGVRDLAAIYRVPVIVTACTALLFMAMVPPLLRTAGAGVDTGYAWNFLMSNVPGDSLETELVFVVLARECLIPFLPMSGVVLVALCSKRWRLDALMVGLGILPYFLVCLILLRGTSEQGAYLLPMTWPYVLLTLRLIQGSRSARIACVIVALSMSVVGVQLHDDPGRPKAFHDGILEVAGGKPYAMVLGNFRDLEAFLVCFQHAPVFEMVLLTAEKSGNLPSALAWFDLKFSELIRKDHVVLMTGSAMRNLRNARNTNKWILKSNSIYFANAPSAQEVLRHLERTYNFEPVASGAFTGFRMSLR